MPIKEAAIEAAAVLEAVDAAEVDGPFQAKTLRPLYWFTAASRRQRRARHGRCAARDGYALGEGAGVAIAQFAAKEREVLLVARPDGHLFAAARPRAAAPPSGSVGESRPPPSEFSCLFTAADGSPSSLLSPADASRAAVPFVRPLGKGAANILVCAEGRSPRACLSLARHTRMLACSRLESVTDGYSRLHSVARRMAHGRVDDPAPPVGAVTRNGTDAVSDCVTSHDRYHDTLHYASLGPAPPGW